MKFDAIPDFREEKAAQVAARFLQKSGGTMNYMKLLKLMYFTEREALVRWGTPVVFDTYASLPHGPVLSRTYDLMKLEPNPGYESPWQRIILPTSRYDVRLANSQLPNDQLSVAEEKLIDELFEKYRTLNHYEISEESHKLPEWVNPGRSSFPIALSDILETAGYSPEDIEDIKEHIIADGGADDLCR